MSKTKTEVQTRNSEVRKSIIEILKETECPITVSLILKALSQKNFWPNKTTVYRALKTLIKLGIVVEVNFLEGKKRYELAKRGILHHHHLVCKKCRKSICVNIEKRILKIQQDLEKSFGFQILDHNTEFFGICPKCQ